MQEFPPKTKIVYRHFDAAVAEHLASVLSVPLSIARILAARKLTTFDECKQFFRFSAQSLLDPFLLSGMRSAAERIGEAIDNSELLTVYGDYDADGVTATALMVRGLTSLGANVSYYLPNRLVEGYGLNKQGIDAIVATGCKLIVTVDCGITAANEVLYARSLGVTVIITDHHEPQGPIPDAFAVIDHKLPTCTYPEKVLAGVGVALKVVQALVTVRNLDSALWENLLDLASIGTSADIVPLTGENRVIAALGFEQLAKSSKVGIAALISEKRMGGKALSTSAVVFQIAPCMNAVGRLGDPSIGVELLLTNDTQKAATYAKALIEANIERRTIDAAVQKDAFLWIEKNVDLSTDYSIVAGNAAWHPGVIGIVASKIIERCYRPTILFAYGADGKAKGSGRSIGPLHLLDALSDCREYLLGFGGHAAAAGMSINIDQIDAFRKAFDASVKKRISFADLVPEMLVDTEVEFCEINPKYYRILCQMGPFGPGNRRPVFITPTCSFRSDARIVGDNHLKCSVTSGGKTFDAIGFGLGSYLDTIRMNTTFSVVFSLEENEWNGATKLQLQIKGIYP